MSGDAQAAGSMAAFCSTIRSVNGRVRILQGNRVTKPESASAPTRARPAQQNAAGNEGETEGTPKCTPPNDAAEVLELWAALDDAGRAAALVALRGLTSDTRRVVLSPKGRTREIGAFRKIQIKYGTRTFYFRFHVCESRWAR